MKQDIYQQVTDRIIELLGQGVVPWQAPYLCEVGFPTNFFTMKRYQGINVFLLGSLRFTSPYFLTYRQAQELGGQVRKGERGSLVIKYGTYRNDDEKTEAEDAEAPARRFLKGYTVFNASQIDGIAFPAPQPAVESSTHSNCEQAEAIIAAMANPPSFSEGSAIPCYRPASDSVHMPERHFFTSPESYFSTLFHELAHSTGHQSRLARPSLMNSLEILATGEARKTYAEEELVAEMAAAFLNAHAAIIEAEIQNSAAYLQGWITVLKTKDAKGWLIRAASQAQKAANYICRSRRKFSRLPHE